MGFFQACPFCYTTSRLLLPVSLLLLLILHSSFPQEAYMVEGSGRPLSPKAIMRPKVKQVKKTMMGRALIGSRPPRCERRCRNCGHCEAIQVPVVPQRQGSKVAAAAAAAQEWRRKGRSHEFGYSVPRLQYSRGDGVSNYKPMSWKCKCGNLIFNP